MPFAHMDNIMRPWDAPFEGDPSELDYTTVSECDHCQVSGSIGTMHHARGATGRVCEVLFICHSCRDSRFQPLNQGD
jgi:hypothetical protein